MGDLIRVTLANSEMVVYDYLVLTTGPRLAFEEVEGSGPKGFTESICVVDHAEKAWGKYQQLLERPNPIIIGAMPFANCFGPAYEFAFIVDADFRKRKIRDKFPITFVTSEPYIGHLGLGGVGNSKAMLENELRNHHIKWVTNAKTTKIEDEMYYNFGRIHKTLKVTPAMEAGITDRLWSLEDIAALVKEEAPKKRGSYKKKISN